MEWFKKLTPKFFRSEKKVFPTGVWLKCPECNEALYSKDLENNYKVCLSCDYHFRLTACERLKYLLDKDTFIESEKNITSTDPLNFVDTKRYQDRIKENMLKTKEKEAIITGVGNINGKQYSLAVFNFFFMGGSMGSAVGEKLTRAIEVSLEKKLPFISVSASGGARMQEGTLSLMQMVKTSAAVKKLKKVPLPFISILTDPTTGGVSASFAMLGDVILIEPGALVGFAGARVIQQTINQKLPDGFQRADFLLQHGIVDKIIHRKDLPKQIDLLVSAFNHFKD